MKYCFVFFGVLFGLIVWSCAKDVGLNPELNKTFCDTISYSQDVRGILDTNCVICHDASFVGKDYTSYDGIKQKIDNGTFYVKVIQTREMPLTGSITEMEYNILKCWYEKGGPNN